MTTDPLREALERYRASSINAYDDPRSWRALAELLDACDAALATQPEPWVGPNGEGRPSMADEDRLTEDEIMLRLSSDNPKSRHHREDRADGWSSWQCVPVRDVIEVRALALAAQPEPLDVERLDIRWLLDNSNPMHYLGCDTDGCSCGVSAQYDAIIDRQAAREYAALSEDPR